MTKEALDKAIFLQKKMARCDINIKGLQEAMEEIESDLLNATWYIYTEGGALDFTLPKDYAIEVLRDKIEKEKAELTRMQEEFEKL